MDICDMKHQVNTLLQGIFAEYNRIEDNRIQSKCENDLELKRLSERIRSLESAETSSINLTNDLETQIKTLKKQIHEYETIINSLQDKLNLAEEEDMENNKFDMLRIQSKELTLKDREIERLNRLIKNLKQKNETSSSNKIDNVFNNIINKNDPNNIVDIKDKKESDENNKVEQIETHQEISVVEYNTVTEEEPVEEETVEEETVEDDPFDDDPVEEEHVDEEHVEEDPVEEEPVEEDKGELLTLTYRKTKYFIYDKESPQNVYEYLGDNKIGKVMGIREMSTTTKGKPKFKIKLYK